MLCGAQISDSQVKADRPIDTAGRPTHLLAVSADVVLPPEIAAWFDGRGWRVRRHQSEMLEAADAGHHALLVADTGAGKTLAGFLPTLADFAPSRLAGTPVPEGLHTLY